MKHYGVPHEAFAPFALEAHANAQRSDVAVFNKKALDLEQYESAAIVTQGCPIQVGTHTATLVQGTRRRACSRALLLPLIQPPLRHAPLNLMRMAIAV